MDTLKGKNMEGKIKSLTGDLIIAEIKLNTTKRAIARLKNKIKAMEAPQL